MCGIAGFIAEPGARPERSLLEAMCDRLAHRGPDGAGYFIDADVALGHRRLSIIDVAGGSQPLGNEDGSIQVIFNGEIYNFQELQRGLEHRGHHFSTRSDTEVLAHLYEEVGERLPEYLNGMFAFAIWDRRRRELFLARDRFGKKPLYYSTAVPGQRICFASELKALLLLPGFDRPVNARAVADFLALSYIPDPDTIFDGVFKLPAGHSLKLGLDGEPRIRRYWEPAFAADPGLNYNQTVEEVRELTSDAVRLRLISDVPLGAFLSGGVDSSAVVALMAQHSREPVKSFSIGFTVRAFDELEFARMVAERYRTEHREQTVSMDMYEALAILVEHFDEPFADASAIPMLYLSRMTREHVTVALCGDGADELFAGYRRYTMGMVEAAVRRRLPGWFRKPVFGTLGGIYPKFDYLPRMFRGKMLLTALSQEIGRAHV